VIVVFGNDRDVRISHGAAATAGAGGRITANTTKRTGVTSKKERKGFMFGFLV